MISALDWRCQIATMFRGGLVNGFGLLWTRGGLWHLEMRWVLSSCTPTVSQTFHSGLEVEAMRKHLWVPSQVHRIEVISFSGFSGSRPHLPVVLIGIIRVRVLY